MTKSGLTLQTYHNYLVEVGRTNLGAMDHYAATTSEMQILRSYLACVAHTQPMPTLGQSRLGLPELLEALGIICTSTLAGLRI